MSRDETAARKSPRRRRWLIALLALLLLAILLVVAGWLWLFHSSSGRDFVLAQISAALPTLEDDRPALAFDRADGVLADTLHLYDLRYDLGDGLQLNVDDVELGLSPGALLARRLEVSRLLLTHPVLRLGEAPTDTKVESPELVWPDLKLPLSVSIADFQLRDGTVTSAGDETLLHVDSLSLRAELDRVGHFALGQFEMNSDYGRFDSRGEADFDGIANGQLSMDWRGPDEAPPLKLLARANRGVLSLDLSTTTSAEQRLQLRIDGDQWQLQSALDHLDPRPWWPEAPVAWLTAKLEVDGHGRQASLSGDLASDVYALHVAESQLALSDDGNALELSPLRVEPADGGQLEARGVIALAAGAAHQLTLHVAQLVLPGTAGENGDQAPTKISGDAGVSGAIDAWTLAFDGSAMRGELLLPLAVEAEGDLSMTTLKTLRAGDEGGRASGSGLVRWDPAVAVNLDLALDGFDPSRLHPEVEGRLDGDVQLAIAQIGDDWRIDVGLERLRGELLGRQVSGDGDAHLGPDAAPSQLNLRVGESALRLQGRGGDAPDLRLSLAPLRLQDLLPEVSGELRGDVRLTGSFDRPDLQASLEGDSLRQDELRIGRLSLEASGSFDSGSADADMPLDLRLSLRDLAQGEARFDTATLALNGSAEQHRIEFSADGETLGLALKAHGSWRQPLWQGVVEEASVAPADRPVWRLQQPADLRIDDGQVSLSRSCLKGQVVSLCGEASGNRQQQTAAIELGSLPLALVGPWLPRQAGEAIDIGGELSGSARIERLGENLRAELALDSRDGHINYAVSENERLLEWQSLALRATLADGQLKANLQGHVEGDGTLDASIDGGSPLDNPDAAINGRLHMALPRLRALSLVEPELSDASAKLDGDLSVSGTWQAPQFSGRLLVDALQAEIPALGLKLSDSRLRLDSDDGSRFRLSGEVNSGEGVLSVDGSVDPFAEGDRADLQIRGERVLASDTSLLHVLVSPDLHLNWHAEQGVRLDGKIGVPEGRLDLERIENSVAPSADVVVSDPRPGRGEAGALPIHAEVTVEIGDALRLRGFGFDGRVEGSLAIRERPGRSPTGRGTVSVSGKYQAYGQNLDIKRGRLLFANSALDNPSLDVRAEREFEQQTVGLEVRGTALLPILDVYSDPPLDQAEALSYLVLGRPLRSASGADGAQLGQAAAAIGGNLLAGQLGDRIGLDIGVADSKALGGAAVSVGKYLSPRLYLGYGVSLFGSGQVVTFKYIINRLWEAEVESGRENRVGLNYTLER